jgi:hypothetical protein
MTLLDEVDISKKKKIPWFSIVCISCGLLTFIAWMIVCNFLKDPENSGFGMFILSKFRLFSNIALYTTPIWSLAAMVKKEEPTWLKWIAMVVGSATILLISFLIWINY